MYKKDEKIGNIVLIGAKKTLYPKMNILLAEDYDFILLFYPIIK